MKNETRGLNPDAIWKKHCAAVDFNIGINLYDNV